MVRRAGGGGYDRPVHILHLETGRRLYGGPRQVILLLEGLRTGVGGAGGVTVTLACPTDSAIADAARARDLPVVTCDLGGDLDLACIARLGSVIRQVQPDLVHVHSRRGADLFGGLAALLAGTPAILTRRVDNPDTPLLGTLKYRAYDRIVAISAAVLAQLRAEGVPAEKLRLVRSAVDPWACQPSWTRERFLEAFGLDGTRRVCAVVAQLIPRKGHALLLEAWPMIRNRCGDAQLLIFGTGSQEATLRERADQGGTVTFAGYRADLREFLGHVDLLIHPATQEGLGVSLLEAQAAGVAVVGFDAGGVPEAVENGVTGVLVDPGNPAALADAVIKLLDRPNVRRQLGEAGRRRVEAQFAPGVMVDAYMAIYQEVLGS